MKLAIKLILVALIANAAWHLGNAYMSFYRFKDGVEQAALFSVGKSDAAVKQKVLDLAAQYSVPVDEDNFTFRREAGHTYISGTYTQNVDLLPNYHFPWKFSWSVESTDLSGLK